MSEGAATSTFPGLLQAICDEAERLTQSQVAFVHFLDDHEEVPTRSAWSTATMAQCASMDIETHQRMGATGIWADCVRQRRPVIHEDVTARVGPWGLPRGHPAVAREAVVPIAEQRAHRGRAGRRQQGQPSDLLEHRGLLAGRGPPRGRWRRRGAPATAGPDPHRTGPPRGATIRSPW
ncbi:MAG: GAF domain-containing protein [Actinobacteria bacterium]|nr:GAF domain-containing protein [Actinomycetota bacterium]